MIKNNICNFYKEASRFTLVILIALVILWVLVMIIAIIALLFNNDLITTNTAKARFIGYFFIALITIPYTSIKLIKTLKRKRKVIEENEKLNTTLYLNDDKMAIKIIDETVFTYDLDMMDNIEQNTEGKLIEVMEDIYKKIEDYYQIDLKDYNVKSLN